MPDNPRWVRILGKPQVLFLLFLLAVATAYTLLGSRLSRRTGSGAMGPGYLPLWLGVAAIGGVLIALAIVVTRGSKTRPEADAEDAELAERPAGTGVTLGVVLLAFAGLVVGFTVLGSLVSVVIFVVAMLWYLNRHLVWWIWGVSLAMAVGFWFLFEALGVHLPRGFLL